MPDNRLFCKNSELNSPMAKKLKPIICIGPKKNCKKYRREIEQIMILFFRPTFKFPFQSIPELVAWKKWTYKITTLHRHSWNMIHSIYFHLHGYCLITNYLLSSWVSVNSLDNRVQSIPNQTKLNITCV